MPEQCDIYMRHRNRRETQTAAFAVTGIARQTILGLLLALPGSVHFE